MFIDSFRFKSSSLSSLVDNLSEGLHNYKGTNCKFRLNYISTKEDNQLRFKCIKCKKSHKNHFNKDLIKRFENTYEFCDRNINKFILVYPYDYMDSWERFDEELLPDKEAFYSSLNMEGIIDVDYRHGKKVFKNFSNKNLGDYHDLYVQSDTLLLADIFENFGNKFIEIYELDHVDFLLHQDVAPGCLKKTGIKLGLLTDVDMSLMVEKRVRGGIHHAINRYAEANSKYMKNYDKNKGSSYIQYLDRNNLYGWGMSQKMPVEGFKLKKKYVKI